MQPFDDYDDRRLIENCCIKAAKQQWDLGHPPQKTERAVRVHAMFILLLFALATAYWLLCEREATDGEPVGWQRWRRQLLEQTRDKMMVFAQRISRQESARTMAFSQSRGSRRRLERYVGISDSRFAHFKSSFTLWEDNRLILRTPSPLHCRSKAQVLVNGTGEANCR